MCVGVGVGVRLLVSSHLQAYHGVHTLNLIVCGVTESIDIGKYYNTKELTVL